MRAAAALAVLLSGCSWVMVPRTRTDEPCERSKIAPTIDRIYEVEAASVAVTMALSALTVGRGDSLFAPESAGGFIAVALAATAVAAAFHRSAEFGYREVARCRALSEAS